MATMSKFLIREAAALSTLRLRKAVIVATLAPYLMTKAAFGFDASLLSITGIALDQGHHLTKLLVRTWGVEVLAVCHIPPVSKISVDFDIDPGGVLTWKASSWHGELDQSALETLSALFLVRVTDYQREPRGDPHGAYHPASFEGIATIAAVQQPLEERPLPLTWRNFSLTPAGRCPDPG
jgi:hypothetical protein